jgi:hypothetical protein
MLRIAAVVSEEGKKGLEDDWRGVVGFCPGLSNGLQRKVAKSFLLVEDAITERLVDAIETKESREVVGEKPSNFGKKGIEIEHGSEMAVDGGPEQLGR